MSQPQLPEGYTQEEFNSLTEVEKEALGVELDDKGPAVKVEAGSEEHKAAEEARVAAEKKPEAKPEEKKPEAEAKPAAEAKPEEKKPAPAAAAAVEPGDVQDTPDPKPIVPGFKAGKLISDEQHNAAQVALAKKFEDGEIATPEFIRQNDALTRAKIASDLAVASSAQGEEAQWQARQDAFFSTPGNEILRDDKRAWAALQAQLEDMYADDKYKTYTDMQYLNEAGREVRKLLGLERAPAAKKEEKPAAAAAKPKGTDVDVPTTLADTPAAAENLDGGSEFANVDKLEGMEYELAIAKMTPEQKARFLAI